MRIEQPKIIVSWGEFIDKVTILRIKATKISDKIVKKNVERELNYLENTILSNLQIDPYLKKLFDTLSEINNKLWEIEDKIREKEKLSDFGDEFIELARSVYITNDERAKYKRDINIYLNSEFIEEKSYQNYR